MKRAVVYGAFGGILGGMLLGGGTFVFGEFFITVMASWVSTHGLLTVLLILPFALTGALVGSFCAYVVVFGSRELSRFAGSWQLGWRRFRRPIGWLTLTGALAAVLLARGLPVPPGLYPHFLDQRGGLPSRGAGPNIVGHDAVGLDAVAAWRAIETLQMSAFASRGDGFIARFERLCTRVFFAFLPEIHAIALLVLGATITGWSALVCATFQVSRRAGGEAVFWSLWLLAGGFFLGIVAGSGFGLTFQGLGARTPAELYVYTMVNTGIPAAWITLTAGAGITAFGLLGLSVARRSVLVGLLTFANAGAVLLLGTTTRLTLALKPPVPDPRGSGVELPTSAWHILTYFEGHLVNPYMTVLPSAPLATLGVALGVGMIFGGACYGAHTEKTSDGRIASRALLNVERNTSGRMMVR